MKALCLILAILNILMILFALEVAVELKRVRFRVGVRLLFPVSSADHVFAVHGRA